MGADHADTVKLIKNLASLMQSTRRAAEAEELNSRAVGLISGSWKAVELPTEGLYQREES